MGGVAKGLHSVSNMPFILMPVPPKGLLLSGFIILSEEYCSLSEGEREREREREREKQRKRAREKERKM